MSSKQQKRKVVTRGHSDGEIERRRSTRIAKKQNPIPAPEQKEVQKSRKRGNSTVGRRRKQVVVLENVDGHSLDDMIEEKVDEKVLMPPSQETSKRFKCASVFESPFDGQKVFQQDFEFDADLMNKFTTSFVNGFSALRMTPVERKQLLQNLNGRLDELDGFIKEVKDLSNRVPFPADVKQVVNDQHAPRQCNFFSSLLFKFEQGVIRKLLQEEGKFEPVYEDDDFDDFQSDLETAYRTKKEELRNQSQGKRYKIPPEYQIKRVAAECMQAGAKFDVAATNMWNGLYHATVEEVEYPKTQHDPEAKADLISLPVGSNFDVACEEELISNMLVVPQYRRLVTELAFQSKRNRAVTGSAGTGKTTFGRVLLMLARYAGVPVVYQRNNKWYLFFEDHALSCIDSSFLHFAMSNHNFLIIRDPQPNQFPGGGDSPTDGNPFTVFLLSDGAINLNNNFYKQAIQHIMEPWGFGHGYLLCKHCPITSWNEDAFNKAWDDVGGIPRLLLSEKKKRKKQEAVSALFNDIHKKFNLQTLIHHVNSPNAIVTRQISGYYLHMYRSLPELGYISQNHEYKFANKKLTDELWSHVQNECINNNDFFLYSASSLNGTFYGVVFERAVCTAMELGGTFLFYNYNNFRNFINGFTDFQDRHFGIKINPSEQYQAIDFVVNETIVKKGVLYWCKRVNFPDLDGFIIINKCVYMFQVTVSFTHGYGGNGVYLLQQAIEESFKDDLRNKPSDYKLIYVLPEHVLKSFTIDIAQEYTKTKTKHSRVDDSKHVLFGQHDVYVMAMQGKVYHQPDSKNQRRGNLRIDVFSPLPLVHLTPEAVEQLGFTKGEAWDIYEGISRPPADWATKANWRALFRSFQYQPTLPPFPSAET